MTGRAALRASDADRESAAERLRAAAAEGRLLTEELEQRLERAFAARTYGQLDAVLSDLPRGRVPAPRHPAPGPLVIAGSAFTFLLAVTVTLAAIVAVLFMITGVFAGWLLWVAFAWLFMARRRRLHRGAPWVACGGYAPRRGRRLSA